MHAQAQLQNAGTRDSLGKYFSPMATSYTAPLPKVVTDILEKTSLCYLATSEGKAVAAARAASRGYR